MKRLVLITIILVIVPKIIHAQEGWVQIYGGGGSVQQTTDGGYVITSGESLTKLDSLGNIEWIKDGRYGSGENGSFHIATYSGIQTSDEGYVMAGEIHWYDIGGYDFCLIKTDEQGDTLWMRTYGETSIWERAYCVQQTEDGGYILSGYKLMNPRSILLVKTDSIGDVLWSRTYGVSSFDYHSVGRCVQQTADKGYIITGRGKDWFLLKTDSLGEPVWATPGVYNGNEVEKGFCVDLTSDGGYIVVGQKYWNSWYSRDLWLAKIDSSGNRLWDRLYEGDYYSDGHCVEETSDEGYIITGFWGRHSTLLGQARDVWLIKTDSEGNVTWSRTYASGKQAEGHWVQQTTDGGYIITGEGFLAIKTNEFGNFQSRFLATKIYSPEESEVIGTGIRPSVEFSNLSNETIRDLIYHCEIVGLTDPDYYYHDDSSDDTTIVYNIIEPFLSKRITFEEWQGEAIGNYEIRFYATGDVSDTLNLDTVSMVFYWKGIVAITEHPAFTPTFELLTSIGPRVTLRFADANRSQGDCVAIFDATGRKVDKLSITGNQVLTWGDGFNPGVYFIMADIDGNHQTEKVILVK